MKRSIMKRFRRRFEAPQLALIVIIVIGAVLRFYNLNWDQFHYFHPDERNIASAVSRIKFFSQMNPEFFAYGSFPIYLIRAIGELFNHVSSYKGWTSDWGHINLIARAVSAFFSTLTIPFLYILGVTLGGVSVGLLAAWFAALTPFLIQEAHFGVTESMITFFGVLLTTLAVTHFGKLTKRHTALMALLFGIAVATKMSALSFGSIVAIDLLVGTWKSKVTRKIPGIKVPQFRELMRLRTVASRVLLLLFHCILASITAALTFTILSPYTFLSWNKFMESMRCESGITWGSLVVVYVYQFLHTIPYLYPILQFPFTFGPLLATLGIVGYFYVIAKGLVKRRGAIIFTFLWPTIYFAIVGGWFAKFIRYLVPIYPFLILAAALLVADILHTAPKKMTWLGVITISLICVAVALPGLAFMTIYTHPQTKIEAPHWIYSHISTKAKLLTEHWDDGLPLQIDEKNNPGKFKTEQLTIYEPDDEKKSAYYAEKLSGADFIIINSKRLYGTLMYLPEKYPITSKYYRLLFDGQLGYARVAQFFQYPSLTLGPWMLEFNDDNAEETFQVYDHPKVMIFQNVSRLTKEQIQRILR